MTFKKFIKNEIEGWKKLEVTWLLIACAVIVVCPYIGMIRLWGSYRPPQAWSV